MPLALSFVEQLEAFGAERIEDDDAGHAKRGSGFRVRSQWRSGDCNPA